MRLDDDATPAYRATGDPELRRQVAAYLADQPRQEMTPGEVAIGLNQLATPVAKALAALSAAGHAELTTILPARYRATPTTVTAAVPPPPRP